MQMLHKAIEKQDIKEVENLLRNSHTNVNERDATLQTPLHLACNVGCRSIVQELINKQADVNAIDKNNWTPLHCAVQSTDLDTILLLLDSPTINVNILSKDGTSVFHYLVRRAPPDDAKYLRVLNKMLEKGVDINLAGKHFESPLHQATGRRNICAVKFLLENGANIDPRNKFEETPLFYAVRANNKELVQLFLTHKADVSIKSVEGKTILDVSNPEYKSMIIEYIEKNPPNKFKQENYQDQSPKLSTSDNQIPVGKMSQEQLRNFQQQQIQQHLLFLQYVSAAQNHYGIVPANCIRCNELFCYPVTALSAKCPTCKELNVIDQSKPRPAFPPPLPSPQLPDASAFRVFLSNAP